MSDRGDPVPTRGLSEAQQEIAALQASVPRSPMLNETALYELHGHVDTRRLAGAVDAVNRRHPILALVLEPDGRGWRAGEPRPAELRVVDASAEDAWRLAAAEAQRPFDLTAEPPFRALLVRAAPARSLLLVSSHAIACDRRSLEVIVHDLGVLYSLDPRTAATPLPPPTATYLELATQSDADVEGRRRSLEYWRSKLSGFEPTELPADLDGDAGWALADYAGAELPAALVVRVDAVARERRVSRFSFLATAVATAIAGLGDQSNITLVTSIENRSTRASRWVVGPFSGGMAIRIAARPEAHFADLLRDVQRTVLEGIAQQRIRFDDLLAELEREGVARESFARLSFDVRDPSPDLALSGVAARPVALLADGSTEDDEDVAWSAGLQVGVEVTHDGAARLTLVYSTNLFSSDRADAIAAGLVETARNAVQQPHARVGELAATAAAAAARTPVAHRR